MIDLHCHLLPGIDDGPKDVEGSLELARAAHRAGTRTIAATPHLREDHPAVRPAELAERCAELGRRFAQESIGVTVVPAAEVDLLWALDADDDSLRLASYAQRGTDLLVETPYGELPSTFEQLLFRLAMRRYRVILAHPERNPTLQADRQRLAALVERGVRVQLTARSLLRDKRSRSGRTARELIRSGLVHVIASDAHDAGPHRGPDLSGAVKAAGRSDRARSSWMVNDAPAAILAGQPLPDPPAGRRRLGDLLRRRSAARDGGGSSADD